MSTGKGRIRSGPDDESGGVGTGGRGAGRRASGAPVGERCRDDAVALS